MGKYISFTTPDRLLGITIDITAPKTTDGIGVYRLKPAPGSSVIFEYALAGKSTQVFGDFGFVQASVPQSDVNYAWPVYEGKWTVVIGNDGSAQTAKVKLYARRSNDGKFHKGIFDVNVFFAPNTVDASYMEKTLNYLATHLGSYAGIIRGPTTYQNIAAQYTTIDNKDEYRQMLQLSTGVGTAPALNIFVVGDFANGTYGNAIGVAGGVPASPMVHGTPRSGIAFQPSGDPAYDAHVLSHETGHLAGLFHTSEFAVAETDGISDTPECAQSTILNNPTNCPDFSNIMFPTAGNGGNYSQFQRKVLQGSAFYRGALSAGGPYAPPLIPLGPGSKKKNVYIDAPVYSAWPVAKARKPQDAIEQVLGGIWCARGGDYEALVLGMLPSGNTDRLEELALDEDAFDLVRARALRVLARAADTPAKEDVVVALSKKLLPLQSTGRALQVAAVVQLGNLAPVALGKLVEPAALRQDAVVAHHLDRFGLP